MIKVLLSIIFLSFTGIFVFFMIMNHIIHKIFYLAPVANQKTPNDFKLNYETLFIKTSRAKKVQLWEINSRVSYPVLIAVHGWANSADSLLPLAQKLVDRCHLFLLNTRNHGDSDEERYMTITKYKEDISRALDHVTGAVGSQTPIILLGHSFGGAASLYAATKDPRVKGVISISAFADLDAVLRAGFANRKLLESFTRSLLTYIEFRADDKLENLSPLHSIKKFKGATLIVHGTKDEIVAFTDMNKIMRAAARDNVQELIMKGHSHSSLLQDEELAVAIKHFLGKYFSEKA